MKKQRVFVWLGAFVAAACVLLFSGNMKYVAADGRGVEDDPGFISECARRVEGLPVSSDGIVSVEVLSDDGHNAVFNEERAGLAEREDNKKTPVVDADVDADVVEGDDDVFVNNDEGDAENSGSLKERVMRERFGVMLRNKKWIPVADDASNMVYITTGSLPVGRVGDVYHAQFEAVSGHPPYLWSVAGGVLPQSLTLDVSSGVLTGVPIEPVTAGFFLEVTDSRGVRDMAEYFLVFHPDQALEIITEALPAALPGQEYVFQLEGAGGVPPYVWNVTGDLREMGDLFFDSQTGLLYGEIYETSAFVDIPLVFWLSDAQADVSKKLLLYVRSSLSILEIDEFSVLQASPFEFSFKAIGGVEPYAWSFDGELPPGLNFLVNGVCSGVPSEPGVYQMSASVRDSAGQMDLVKVIIRVLPVVSDSISGFEAFLSRNSVALKWLLPPLSEGVKVHVVRSSDGRPESMAGGVTVYSGTESAFVDRDVGAGSHYYTAFLELDGVIVTSSVPPVIYATLPPEISPFADRVVSADLLHPNAFGSDRFPDVVLGAPTGMGLERGSLNVLSLGAATNDDDGATAPYGGLIILEFVDNVVWNGPGTDFTVFENVFYIYNKDGVLDPETRYMEPAVVSVSQDGITWHQFPIDFSPRYHPESGKLNLRHPYCYNSGFAGVNPVMSNGYDPDPTDPDVSGGDGFDLSDVGLDWIRYVHVQSTGHKWVLDSNGTLVHHNEDFGGASRSSRSSGFDLDAISAVWMQRVMAH